MDDHDGLAERFEAHRSHLRAVAYRMLGSLSEADDAVQECWLRLRRSDTSQVANLRGWLTTVVARVSLDLLRARRARREEPLNLDGDRNRDRNLHLHLPDPAAGHRNGADPEHEAVLADSVGPALQVVLDMLSPAERLAFVLHDIFAVPFDQIAAILGRSPAAAKQLASRARRRVHRAEPPVDADLARQREVVEAFLAAARDGDFDDLVALLDPDVVLRSDADAPRPGALIRGATTVARGATTVARGAITFGRFGKAAQPALVNGAVGLVVAAPGWPTSVMAFTITRGRIATIDILNDPERVRQLDLTVLD